MKFLHSMIRVKDIKKSLDFYTTLLDLDLKEERRLEDCTLYFLEDKESGFELELTYNDETPKDGYDLGNGFGHFAFYVESMEEFTKKVNSYGYEYLYKPFDLNGKGSIIAFLQDPDGYEIEIIEKVNW